MCPETALPSRVFVNGPYGALTGVLHRRGDPCGRPAVRRVIYVFAPARPQNVGDCRRAAARAAPTVIDAVPGAARPPWLPPAGGSCRGASRASAVTERGRRRGGTPLSGAFAPALPSPFGGGEPRAVSMLFSVLTPPMPSLNFALLPLSFFIPFVIVYYVR